MPTTAPPSSESDKFVVRFPDGMRKQIKVAAIKNRRSMNAEIVQRLIATFEAEAAQIAEPAPVGSSAPGRVILSGTLESMGLNSKDENFARITHEEGSVLITGLTDDNVRALAPQFFSLVSVEIGSAS